jgi:carbamate kinase
MKQEKEYAFMEDAGRGYRRVVPSPQPINIVELDNAGSSFATSTCVTSVTTSLLIPSACNSLSKLSCI